MYLTKDFTRPIFPATIAHIAMIISNSHTISKELPGALTLLFLP
jgi:hypothetical protein